MRRNLVHAFSAGALAAVALCAWTAPAAAASSEAALRANLAKIELPPGFRIDLYAAVPDARQMAFGADGTLFVGSMQGDVHAVVEKDGGRTVRRILKGLDMPTGLAVRAGALYVAAHDRILRYDDAERRLDDMPKPKVVYADLPASRHHGWKYLAFDAEGRLYFGVGAPCNICDPPAGTAELRRLDLATGKAETVATGIRNTVGGDFDPRSGAFWFTDNGRDNMGDDMPSDELDMLGKVGAHFGYPYCHQGDTPDPKFAAGRTCGEFTPPVAKLGAHVAPLGMKFYTGTQFPDDYRNAILIAEHGSWNRSVYSGGRVVRVVVDAKGKVVKQDVLAAGFLRAGNRYIGRPVDVVVAKDGSVLVSDDYAGAVYRISYAR